MMASIQALERDREAEAAHVLARAFVSNPLHVAVFGRDQLAANEAFFRVAVGAMKGSKLVAVDGSRIVGVVHWVASPDCQFSAGEKLKTFPTMVKGFGLGSALEVGKWLTVWSKHDPKERHLHLGPIGVAPEAQGAGIGRQLMEELCRTLSFTRCWVS